MQKSGSGSLCSESAQCQSGGVRSGEIIRSIAKGLGRVTGKRNSGMDEDIGITDNGVVVRHKYGLPGDDEDECRPRAVKS